MRQMTFTETGHPIGLAMAAMAAKALGEGHAAFLRDWEKPNAVERAILSKHERDRLASEGLRARDIALFRPGYRTEERPIHQPLPIAPWRPIVGDRHMTPARRKALAEQEAFLAQAKNQGRVLDKRAYRARLMARLAA